MRSPPRLLVVDIDDALWFRIEPELTDLVVDDVASFEEARPFLTTRGYGAIVLGVDRARDLDVLPSNRRAGVGIPVLAIARKDDLRIANHAQLLDVECVFGDRVVDNVRAFAERMRQPTTRPRGKLIARAERLAERSALSARERELIQAVAGGIKRTAIAAHLGISENTAKTMIRRALKKLDLPNIASLGRALLEGSERRVRVPR